MHKVFGILMTAALAVGLSACEPTINREVLLVGDSVTFQSVSPIVEQFNNVDEGKGRYAPVFGSVSSGQGLTSVVNVDMANVDAFWTEHVRSLVEHTKPEVMIVELGYNDCPRLSGYDARIDNFMEQVPSSVPVNWLTVADPGNKTTCDATINAALAAAATRWPNFRTLPYTKYFNVRPQLFQDNVHLNAKGQAELARFLKASLDHLYPPQ